MSGSQPGFLPHLTFTPVGKLEYGQLKHIPPSEYLNLGDLFSSSIQLRPTKSVWSSIRHHNKRPCGKPEGWIE